jgi:hypothetical protein
VTRFKKFVVGFDVNGDQQCPKSNEIFFKFVEDFKPDYRIAGGDIWDFRPLRGKASAEEKRESVFDDYHQGMEWMTRFRPTHFLLGNHDNRIWETAKKEDGILSDFCQQGVNEITSLCKSFKCQMLPYDVRKGILKIGHLKILHGFYCGDNAPKRTAWTYGSCLFGHIHSIDEQSIPGLDRRVGRACGCLCKLDMEYLHQKPGALKHVNGFVYGIINEKTGAYFVWQGESIDGHWILPSDITSYEKK